MAYEPYQGRSERGSFAPKYKPGDLEEIREMIKDGKTERAIKVAIMQARDVSEPTAKRWIKIARKGGVKRNHGKQHQQK
jgi:hypothetical protein